MTTYTRDEILANRRQWVDACLSGNYTQTRDRLVSGAGATFYHCCLGVACDTLAVSKFLPEIPAFEAGEVGGFESGLLTDATADALGLIRRGPIALWHDRWVSLAVLNDGFRFTLPEIGIVISSQADDWDGSSHMSSSWWYMDDHLHTIPHPHV